MTTINTNIGALNAIESIDKANSTMSEAMERLSSGLRINSAADDAAGSAIASKMESAVRSLSVAIRNSHDAISMTQTAEGALGEIENILQRVRELSVQASNSTLSASDRSMIQSEVTALTAEIDKIAGNTNFNGVNLLDGNRNSVNFQIGINASDALEVALQKSDSTSLGLVGSQGVRTLTSSRIPEYNFSGTNITKTDIKLNGEDMFAAAFAGNGSGTVANGVELLVTAINANTKKHGAVASGFNNVTSNVTGDFKMSTNFTINSHTVAIASSYSELVTNINKSVADIEAKLNSDNTITLFNDTGDQIFISNTTGTTDVGFTSETFRGFIQLQNLDGSAVTIETGNAVNGYGPSSTGEHTQLGQIGFMENKNNVTESDIVSATALTLAHDIKINDVKIGASTTESAKHKADAINALTSEHGVTADAKTVLEAVVDFTNIATNSDVTLNGLTVNFSAVTDIADVVTAVNNAAVGDIRATTDSAGELILTSESGLNIALKDIGAGAGTNQMFNSAKGIHGETITAASMTFTAYGNLSLSTAENSIIKIDGTTADLAHLGLLQQSQALKVGSLGISVSTLNDATLSIGKIDLAIQKVSQFRSSFGAVENRIDASINNLTTLQINTQAAMSRIQDADFAAETSKLTKGQILSQAATSMLAQANASKQNLLVLLQG